MFRLIICLILFLSVCSLGAQSLRPDDETFHWEGGLNLGLNNDGYGFDCRVLYFPCQYVGFKAGLGFAGEIWEWEDLSEEYYGQSYDYAIRFKFNPAIALRSPCLINLKKQDAGIYLFSEPGFILSPGSRGSHMANFFRWDVTSGLNLQIYRYIVSLSYSVSNFSLYSGTPDNHWGIGEKSEYITHSVYIGGAIKF